MPNVDALILLGAVLLLAGIFSSKLSEKAGVPTLLIFMAVGMLAGEEGPLGLQFDDFALAHAAGTLALVLILFDGGLRTTLHSVRIAWAPASALSTGGVLVTAGLTGAFATWLLGLPPLTGFLLGSIVGSTDAAAVFAVLRGQGLALRDRIAGTLEVESGSNDPMAVLLTLGLVSYLTGGLEVGWPIGAFFAQQVIIGAVSGLAVGWIGTAAVRRVLLDAAGLYPVLTLALGLLAYGLPAYLGGSGFLSVYLAGIVMGNARLPFRRGILLSHDGAAWLAQIAMFVVLGLLATPSRLIEIAPQGTLLAVALMFVARPVAVLVSLAPFGFSGRELTFLSWAGLKGAVPIILATYPLLGGVEGAPELFDIVFYVVIMSALLQGWTLPWVATRLGVREKQVAAPPISLEISSLRDVDGDIVDYLVDTTSFAAGRMVRDLALPDSAVIAMVVRERVMIPPRGSTAIHAGDHVFVILKPSVRPVVDQMFALRSGGPTRHRVSTTFSLSAATTVGDFEDFYGHHLDSAAERTLADVMAERLGDELSEGASIFAGELRLSVRVLVDGRVEGVEVEIPADADGDTADDD